MEADIGLAEATAVVGLAARDTSPPAEHYLESEGLRLRWLDWGGTSTQHLVFLHGGGLTVDSWELVCLALRDRFHCVALDARPWPKSAL